MNFPGCGVLDLLLVHLQSIPQGQTSFYFCSLYQIYHVFGQIKLSDAQVNWFFYGKNLTWLKFICWAFKEVDANLAVRVVAFFWLAGLYFWQLSLHWQLNILGIAVALLLIILFPVRFHSQVIYKKYALMDDVYFHVP